jgi:hypothetical protein
MSLAVKLDVSDGLKKVLEETEKALDPISLRQRLAVDVTNLFQDNYRSLPTNRLGGRSTGFWPDAARSTHFDLVGDGFVITTSKQGVLQQYKGGTIKPRPGKKYLTIPARAEAHGKLASDFNNLRFAFTEYGPALVEADASKISIGRQKKDGSRTVKNKGETGGKVMFWLRRMVTQRPNEDVIPKKHIIEKTVVAAAEDHVSLEGAQ